MGSSLIGIYLEVRGILSKYTQTHGTNTHWRPGLAPTGVFIPIVRTAQNLKIFDVITSAATNTLDVINLQIARTMTLLAFVVFVLASCISIQQHFSDSCWQRPSCFHCRCDIRI